MKKKHAIRSGGDLWTKTR